MPLSLEIAPSKIKPPLIYSINRRRELLNVRGMRKLSPQNPAALPFFRKVFEAFSNGGVAISHMFQILLNLFGDNGQILMQVIVLVCGFNTTIIYSLTSSTRDFHSLGLQALDPFLEGVYLLYIRSLLADVNPFTSASNLPILKSGLTVL